MSKLIKNLFKISSFVFSIGCNLAALALEYPLPAPGHDLVGEITSITANQGDTLSSIGMQHDIGYFEMVEANQDLPRNGAIKPGTEVMIPSRFVLPSVRQGLVVNLAELRVYYYPKNQSVVYTFPIGAGREGWNTPRASTYVDRKKEDPTWVVPDSIRAESLRDGRPLKKFYPPGPDNPLGKYAIYLGIPGIRIHGTNMPASVGRRVSHGCIRLLPDDIDFLYHNVPLRTPVRIIHEATKVGWDGPVLYLEAEVPFNEYTDDSSAQKAIAAATQSHPATTDWQQVNQVVNDQEGIPIAIGHDSSIRSLPAEDQNINARDDSDTNATSDQTSSDNTNTTYD